MPEPTEIRYWSVEYRSQVGRRMTGRVLSYGREYDLGRFTETYRPGVFRKSITEAAKSLPLMIEHGLEKIPVGVATEWLDDDEALVGTWRFDTRSEAVEAARLAEARILSGLSVGFTPIISDWTTRPDGRHHALRKEARMIETSMCAVPALDDAGVFAVRSMGHQEPEAATPNLDSARAWLAAVRSGTVKRNG